MAPRHSKRVPSIVGEAIPGWGEKIIPARVALRAHTKADVNENGCWISRYSTQSAGYAQIGWRAEGKTYMVLAHRASWEHVNGRIPPGYTIDHIDTCKTKRCVNPRHLRILSNFENGRRTAGRDWPVGECLNGHDNSELIQIGTGRWRCRLCRDEYSRRYRAKKKLSA